MTMGLPHDRAHLLWNDGPTRRFKKSIESWVKAMYTDDPSMSESHDVRRARSTIVAKSSGVLCGEPVLNHLFNRYCHNHEMHWRFHEGSKFQCGDVLLEVTGNTGDLLKIERVCMNVITRLSGIATSTSEWQEKTHPVRLAATRKTNWGVLDKWAVHTGGGLTHRLDRSDGIMIKENDFAVSDSPEFSLIEAKSKLTDFLVVEVVSAEHAFRTAKCWEKILLDSASCDRITLLLDNLDPDECTGIADIVSSMGLRDSVILEGSGGVKWDNLHHWAKSSVDVVSSGTLTMESSVVDMTMLMEAC